MKFIRLFFILPTHANEVITKLKSDTHLALQHKEEFTPEQVKRRESYAADLCMNVSKDKGKCGPKIGRCYSGFCHSKLNTCSWKKTHQNNSVIALAGKAVCRKLLKKMADDKTGAETKKFKALVAEVKLSKKKEHAVLKEFHAKAGKKLVNHGQKYYSGVPKALREIVHATEIGTGKIRVTRTKISSGMKKFFQMWRKGSWKCWCYSDYTKSRKCPNINENKRPKTSYEDHDESETERGE